MGFSHIYFWKMKGLLFYKLFGSGTGEGFTPVLNPNVYAIMSVWETEEIADKSMATTSRVMERIDESEVNLSADSELAKQSGLTSTTEPA